MIANCCCYQLGWPEVAVIGMMLALIGFLTWLLIRMTR